MTSHLSKDLSDELIGDDGKNQRRSAATISICLYSPAAAVF